jgi:hypothetical protein
MRADAHYVDLIESRSSLSSAASDTSADQTPDRASPEVSAIPDEALHAGRELAHALKTVAGCAALLSDAPSELSRTVVGDLIRAETWRASVLLQATRVLRRELSVARQVIPASRILDSVLAAFQPERRVRSIAVELRSTLVSGAIVVGDEALIAGSLSGALLATVAILDEMVGASITIAAAPDRGAGVAFSVSQTQVKPPATWQTRAFDRSWTDRPGGVPALAALLGLRAVAEIHGGRARAERSGHGTTIEFSLPPGV